LSESATWRRRLRNELKQLRSQAELTQREVADAMVWSPSKLIRIENGSVGISVTDLRALLAHYRLTDSVKIEELEKMAKGSKRQPFAEYRDVLVPETIRFLGYESSASLIRLVQPLVVPGLLQTEEYTRALLKSSSLDEHSIDRVVESRKERQDLLEAADAPGLFVILDQSVLWRAVGGIDVMTRQLDRLRELGAKRDITIQVLPLSLGATGALNGPFVQLEFSDSNDPVVFLENATRTPAFIDDPDITGPYQEEFIRLEDLASSPGDLNDQLELARSFLERGFQ
jgi:transcriptional regulator with XRE-family HTH domain